MSSARAGSSQGSVGRFGTFGGVFTPCTLTILGVIMFLRYGQVVGQSGLVNAIVIVLMAKLITTLTSLSLSAIATNTRVKGGGAYYLISRSLGVEFGGAIGVVFYLAQAVSVALYVIGFAEAFQDGFPGLSPSIAVTASVLNALVFISVFIGAGWTIKVQYGILAALGLSLVSFYVGAAADFDLAILKANLQPAYQPGSGFYAMFALFFPAATGIMAGANMSGDLRDPGRSIPKGTLLAIAVTAAVYLSIGVLFAGTRPQHDLISNNLIIKDIAWSGVLIALGVYAATLSSALGSMMGAPRILQAFANDEVFRSIRLFAKGSGKNREPRRAIALTFVISQAAILLGNLDVIAPVITMFFMITYGTLNVASFYEAYTRNPSYRPRFKYSHWATALAGAAGCVAVMFLMQPVWAAVSIAAMAGLRWYISRKNIKARWGDVKSGIAFERARKGLLRLEDEKYHPKNWRPIILALSGSTWNRANLVMYGHWLTAGHGILSLANIIAGKGEQHFALRESQETMLRKAIRARDLDAFPVVIVAPSVPEGVQSLLQGHGLGGFRPNTVLIGWTGDSARYDAFLKLLGTTAALGKSILLLRCKRDLSDAWFPPGGSIDVWWRGRENGSLMLLLAHLLAQNDQWRNRRIRLLRAIGDESGRETAERHLSELVEMARIPAEPLVVVSSDVCSAIQEQSRSAGVVFLGFRPPTDGRGDEFVGSLDRLCGDLQTVIFVASAGGVELAV